MRLPFRKKKTNIRVTFETYEEGEYFRNITRVYFLLDNLRKAIRGYRFRIGMVTYWGFIIPHGILLWYYGFVDWTWWDWITVGFFVLELFNLRFSIKKKNTVLEELIEEMSPVQIAQWRMHPKRFKKSIWEKIEDTGRQKGEITYG